MRKISLTVIGLYLMVLHAFSQVKPTDTSGNYKNKELKIEEVNLISGYYNQDGNHSAVTGGIGTQKVEDVYNIIQLKFLRWDDHDRKHTMETELGIDHHTAASSAYVSTTGASNPGGTRVYPSLNFKTENEAKHKSSGWGLSYSGEFNYHSYGGNFTYAKSSKNNNREFNAKAQIYLDRVKMITPSEFNTTPVQTVQTVTNASGGGGGYFGGGGGRQFHEELPSESRNTYQTSFTFSQIMNKNLQFSLLADFVAQTGYLGLPFHRVYWNDGTVHIEKLPDNRYKLPIGFRLHYFAGDKVIIRTYYRYYTDSWGLSAHTASIETPVKLTSFVSISPFYRFYKQTAAKYFAPYQTHVSSDAFYTSNYDLSAFSANYIGVNFRMTPPRGVLGIHTFNMLEIRAGHYVQSTGLSANSIALNLRFK